MNRDATAAPEPEIARPTDADLDVDLSGVTIRQVGLQDGVADIAFGGGCGSITAHGERHDVLGTFRGRFELLPAAGVPGADAAFFRCLATVDRWRHDGVPLRVIGAPGRMTVFMEDEQHWLPVSRVAPHRLDAT